MDIEFINLITELKHVQFKYNLLLNYIKLLNKKHSYFDKDALIEFINIIETDQEEQDEKQDEKRENNKNE